jgi:hypothetical protein
MQARRTLSVRPDATTMIQEALASDLHSAVIFSASTHGQVAQISKAMNAIP